MSAPYHYPGLRMEPLGHACGVGVYVSAKMGGVNCSLLVNTGVQVSIISLTYENIWEVANVCEFCEGECVTI